VNIPFAQYCRIETTACLIWITIYTIAIITEPKGTNK